MPTLTKYFKCESFDPVFKVVGEFKGDIKFNDLNASIFFMEKPTHRGHYPQIARVSPFTQNCGIKTLQNLYTIRSEKDIKQIESFLFFMCNTGIIVGSDAEEVREGIDEGDYEGTTISYIRHFGREYTITPAIWNPNYSWSKFHKIMLFYKYLNVQEYNQFNWYEVDSEGAMCSQVKKGTSW